MTGETPKSPQDSDGRGPDGRFLPGHGGRPRGSRNKATELAEKLMSDDVGSITRAVIDAARGGDMSAARIILDRIAPPRRDRPIEVELPPIRTATDALAALASLVDEMGAGRLTPSEAQAASRVIETAIRVADLSDLEQRLTALEKALSK